MKAHVGETCQGSITGPSFPARNNAGVNMTYYKIVQAKEKNPSIPFNYKESATVQTVADLPL